LENNLLLFVDIEQREFLPVTSTVFFFALSIRY